MNSVVRRLLPALAFCIGMVAGCSDSTGANHPQVTGTVSQLRSNSDGQGGVGLLVLDATSNCDCGIGPRIWIGVTPSTLVRVASRSGAIGEIAVGSRIRATISGNIADSDPQLAGATRIDLVTSF